MKDIKSSLYPDAFYHIYNRANGNEQMFKNEDNYIYFLKKYRHYIHPIADTYAYCLMPNHFHILIGIRQEAVIVEIMKSKSQFFKGSEPLKGLSPLKKEQLISNFLSQQFSHLFNGYTQAFNKKNDRRGSLFMHPFKRKLIDSEAYLIQLVRYIHFNPVKANLCQDLESWKFSSYKTILSNAETSIHRNAVLEWFENKENFIYVHRFPPDFEPF